MIDVKATRRTIIAGAAATAAVPAISLASPFAAPASATPIARLWAQAQAHAAALAAYAGEIAAMQANTGLGWMRLSGPANEIGHARYAALVAILKETPKNIDDLATIARVTRDYDIRNGPALWAHGEFDRASREYHLAA